MTSARAGDDPKADHFRTAQDAIERADASQKRPVIFIHGLWSKPSSWQRWVEMFEAAGYAALAPSWPAEAGGAAAPETMGEVVAHFAGIAAALERRPGIVGQSFGGLIAQTLAGHGLSIATVAIDPAPFRGVLPLPVSAAPVRPPNSQARDDADQAPAPGRPGFQATAENLNLWSETRADTEAVQRGPLLVISTERDTIVPRSVARAAYEQQKRDRHAITEFVQMADRGHSPMIDKGCLDVVQIALAFMARFA